MLQKRTFSGIWQALRPALLFIALYLLLLSIGDVIYPGLAGISGLGPFLLQHPGLYRFFLIVFSMAGALIPVLREGRLRIIYFRQKERENRVLGRRIETKRGLVLACLVLAAASACLYGNFLVEAMSWNSASVPAMEAIYQEISPLAILAAFGIFTPFVEEFVFRGILYTGLREVLPAPAAVFLTSLLFGLYHGDLVQGVYAFGVSLLFCLSMELLRQFEAPWILHGVANFLPLVLSFLGVWNLLSGALWRYCFLICLLLSIAVLCAVLGPGREERPRT